MALVTMTLVLTIPMRNMVTKVHLSIGIVIGANIQNVIAENVTETHIIIMFVNQFTTLGAIYLPIMEIIYLVIVEYTINAERNLFMAVRANYEVDIDFIHY